MDDAFVLDLLDGAWSVVRLPADAPVPAWAWSSQLTSVTRTGQELSILAPSDQVPEGLMRQDRFRALVVRGPLAFDAVGVLAEIAGVLAEAEMPILAVSTYDTDIILVRDEHLVPASEALAGRGHRVVVNGG